MTSTLTAGMKEDQNPTTCQQPAGCERARHNGGDNRLNWEEQNAAAYCLVCRAPMCDECAAWLSNIPAAAVPTERNRPNVPETRSVSGILCSDHFQENWV